MRRSATFAQLGTASWIRVTAVAVAMLAVCLLVVSRSTSAFSGTTSNTNNSLSTGSVVLTDDDSDTALFNVSGMNGGDSVNDCITVTYSGTSTASAVKLYGVSATATLSPYLDLLVEQGADGSTCGTPGSLTTLYNSTTPAVSAGTLEAFNASYGTYAAGLGIGWTPTASQTRAVKITFTVKSDNAAQGKTATPSFTWEVRNA